MSYQQNILISACLLGETVRYNGTDLLLKHPLIEKWQQQQRLISICPEVAGGMPVPREPAEIINGNGKTILSGISKVIDQQNIEVTKEFILGAEKALELALNNHCKFAILTERSPSCGSSIIYDGSFSNTRKEGMGVTTALLEQHGIHVFSQHGLEALSRLIRAF